VTIATDRAVSAHHTVPQAIEIRAFDGPVGAEVLGLDLSQPLAAEDFARIHRAHLDHHVLVFRDQRITPDEQVAFSRRFGPLQIHVLQQLRSWQGIRKC
jgi:taurine dioxygenase